MSGKLLQIAECAGRLLVFSVVLLSGLGWIGIAIFKSLVTKTPLTYRVTPEVSAEIYPMLAVLILFASHLAYVVAKSRVTGLQETSTCMTRPAPRVFAFTLLAFLLWVIFHPAPEASLILPAGFTVVTFWFWYTTAYGFFSGRSRIQVGASGDPDEDPGRLSRPKTTFASLHGNEEIKGRLKEAAQAIAGKRREGSAPRNGILLHGAPGNGKTMFAEALAGEMHLRLVTLAYADIASQWVGEKSARVRAAFDQARRQQPCVLFIDEIDSFLEARDGRNDGTKEDRDLVNAMLTLTVDIRKSRVILIAATNHMDRLDAAGVREGRFDFKVEITPPDLPARIGLLQSGLRKNLPSMPVDDGVIESVAQRWNGFSVKRILAVTEELPSYVESHGLKKVGFEDIMGALRQLQGQRGHVPENVKTMDELVFDRETRETLEEIIGRMSDPEHTERHGGTLPTGILFYGPPGTGKTAACKALAKAIGWAYLPATGADLARDPKRLEALYAKAQDLRPTVIFIDEADELLRDRQFSNATEATNKLLTLMDGVGDRVRDVVWIAATNHPDQIDSALLRGGRFTEKVSFDLPSPEALGRYMQDWLARKNIRLQEGLEAYRIAEAVGACSIANAEAVLQAAVNRAVSRRQVPVTLREEDVQRAVTLVHGAA